MEDKLYKFPNSWTKAFVAVVVNGVTLKLGWKRLLHKLGAVYTFVALSYGS